MSSGLSGFLEKNQPDFLKKIKPKELGFADPISEAGRKRAAGLSAASSIEAPTKVGLTDEARQAQGLTDRSRKRRQFETVFAGETGTIQTSKLGLTGRI